MGVSGDERGGDQVSVPEDGVTANISDAPTSESSNASTRNVSDTPRAPNQTRDASGRPNIPLLPRHDPLPRPTVNFADIGRSPASSTDGQLSPAAADRVFPVRSVISVDPTSTPAIRQERYEGYFSGIANTRRTSLSTGDGHGPNINTPARNRQQSSTSHTPISPLLSQTQSDRYTSRTNSTVTTPLETSHYYGFSRQPAQIFNDILAETGSAGSAPDAGSATVGSDRPDSIRPTSIKSARDTLDDTGSLITARFQHVVTEGGHAIITGRAGDVLQRCEDEPIHIPGAVQGFGLLIALEEQQEGKLVVRIVSENSQRLIGYSPRQLFGLDSFTDILSDDQADNLLDHIDFIRDEDADVATNGPEVFTISIRSPQRKSQKLWCAMHVNDHNPHLIICEFELEDDPVNPLVPPNSGTPEPPEDTLNSQPTAEEYAESTQNSSKPLRVLRSARKRKGEAAAMEVFNIMSQVQEQLAAAPTLDRFLKILVGVVKELTGFHRVMIYQFDQAWNGRVVTELVDPRATKDLYKGLNFPASDIPKQARDLYKINKVRMLYDRDQETARLVCRTMEDLETPLDLTYSYLRAMSPIHLKYLQNMAVRSSMSISINAFEELWGLIACHSYGSKGMRVSFPIRKMCRLVGDSASRNIERLSYASRLQARKLINTVPTANNPSGYIIASSEDLLKLFDADFGMLSIRGETKILGHLEQSQEALAMLEYLRVRSMTNVMTSLDINEDFPDLRYPPGFKVIAGLLLVPLTVNGADFIVFFRKGQLKEVKWAGNPYEKFIKEGTEGYLEPRKSFRTWSETVVGKCREWSEEEIETAAVLCLVYGKFIEVWRQKEAALQNSQLTRLLLANSAHEVRTPLNAIINYLEIALEGTLDQETRDNLAKSHSASKSLIYVINDLLDLTKTEEGGDLVKDEIFELRATLFEATDMFKGDARRKNLSYEVIDHPDLPVHVIGDQRRVRQAISNVTANAFQNTTKGGVKVELYVTSRDINHADVEVSITDTGVGMNAKKLDALFRELEQVQTAPGDPIMDPMAGSTITEGKGEDENRTLGLGLAVVARIVRNMNGQLRLKSEEGKGSRFIIQFPFDLPEAETKTKSLEAGSSAGSVTPHAELPTTPGSSPVAGEVTLVDRSVGRRRSEDRIPPSISRENSAESLRSRKSLTSLKSARSNLSRTSVISGKSEADRLIEAIQEPHRVEGWSEKRIGRSTSRASAASLSARPPLEKRHTAPTNDDRVTPAEELSSRPRSIDVPDSALDYMTSKPGEQRVMDQGTPIRPVRVPEDLIAVPGESTRSTNTAAPISMKEHAPAPAVPQETNNITGGALTADEMRVLVAEDDPVNSRIIKKRLEKLGHDVYLTGNGEECSSTYCDKAGFFDIILMDMQMPIVDGLTSAKMIRSYEKTHPQHELSNRASMNGRVPIIAVSASLVEGQRSQYIQGGFDGWILKPISFNRLSEIMNGIVDPKIRSENLYKAGRWEHGGWFDKAQPSVFDAKTKPSEEAPIKTAEAGASSAGVATASQNDDPKVKEEGESEQSREQLRLLQEQDRAPADSAGDATRSREGDSTNAKQSPITESASSGTSPEDPATKPDATASSTENPTPSSQDGP